MDNEIQSLHFNNPNLQNDVEAKDNTVSVLREKKLTSGPQSSNRNKNNNNNNKTGSKLQMDFEAQESQTHKETEELDHLTQENQQLASENKRLQGYKVKLRMPSLLKIGYRITERLGADLRRQLRRRKLSSSEQIKRTRGLRKPLDPQRA